LTLKLLSLTGNLLQQQSFLNHSQTIEADFISGHVSPNVLYHGDISGAVTRWCGYCKTVVVIDGVLGRTGNVVADAGLDDFTLDAS
jgi:hypothetical protein